VRLPLDPPIYYIDESIDSKILVAAMTKAGAKIQRVGPIVPPGSQDETWLKICGEQGWTALMRDKQIRRRVLEKQALKDFSVGAFTYSGGQATGQQMADRIVGLLGEINLKALLTARPFLYTFGLQTALAKAKL
jgi:hypothetical protein